MSNPPEPRVYDVFPERGGPVFNKRGERITLSDGLYMSSVRCVGWAELTRVCKALEPTNGPLLVKHDGYLDRWSKGHLKVGSYQDEAVAQAVAREVGKP